MRVFRFLTPHLVVLTVFAGYVAYHNRPAPIRSSREEFKQLWFGLTEERVVEILGGPPGDYATHEEPPFEIKSFTGCLEDYMCLPINRAKIWRTNEGCIQVAFSDKGVVDYLDFIEPPSGTWLERHVVAVALCVGLVLSVGFLQFQDFILPPLNSSTTTPPDGSPLRSENVI